MKFRIFILLSMLLIFSFSGAVEVTLEKDVCLGSINYYQETDSIFTTIGSYQRNYPSVLFEAKKALVNQPYTQHVQKSYKIEDGKTSLGATYKCTYGCALRFTYRGQNYDNVCINNICNEGRKQGTDYFCDEKPEVNNDVYYWHTTFWCGEIKMPAVICGQGLRCAKVDGRYTCVGYNVTSNKNDVKDVTYAIEVPTSGSASFKVVAYWQGKKIAEEDLSDLSADQFIMKNGPVQFADAYQYANSTGLTAIVNSKIQDSQHSISQSTTANTNSSWLSKIAAFFGFGRKTTSATSTSATASTYNSTYSTSTYPSYSSASSTSYSNYSTYPRTYSAYSTASTTYTPTYSTAGYSYSAYSTYTNYSYPSSYSYNSSYTGYKPSYTYSSYSSYSYPTYISTYSSYTAPSYSNYTYSYPNYSYSGYSNYSYPSYSNS